MTIQEMTLVESKAREEKAAELELWRQAYNAALNGVYYTIGAETYCVFAAEVADQALANYRAKREEMGI